MLRAICAKLVRRHPHVFGSTVVADAHEVELNWEAIKRRERGDAAAASLLDGLPRHLPALMTAQAIQKRLAGVGATWDSREQAIDWARAQLDALAGADETERDAALGNLLLALAQVARLQRSEAEEVLQAANRRVVRHVRQIEATGPLDGASGSAGGLARAALHELSSSAALETGGG